MSSGTVPRENWGLSFDETIADLLARWRKGDEQAFRDLIPLVYGELMRVFAGLDSTEIAAVLGVSTVTVKRRWAIAKAWLYHELYHELKQG